MGSDGTILEQDSSMSTTHNVYNFNMSTGQNYDTLITCISTMNTFCCVTLVWDGNNWMNASGFNPPPPPPPSVGTCGNFTLELYDSFGDGWNGASLDIIINGALFHSVTLATGSGPEIFTFATDSNDVIDLIYNAGSWDDENTYNLTDNSGNLIVSQGLNGFISNVDPVSVFGIVACVSCPIPTNLSANTSTAGTALLDWNGGSGTFNVEWGPIGFTQGNGTLINNITINSFVKNSQAK